MDVSAEDEEATLTMIEDIHADAVLETEADPAVFSMETHTVFSTEPEAVSTEESCPKAALPNTLSADVSSEQNKSVAGDKDTIMASLETAFATLTSTRVTRPCGTPQPNAGTCVSGKTPRISGQNLLPQNG